MTPAATARRRLLSTTLGLVLGGLAYFLTLFNYTWDLDRNALAQGYFSHFFDLQARAMLDGGFAVPEGSLGIEGFVHDGKTYTYFPPWPSVLRLPVLMTTDEFDARLTLLSMAIAWIVLAVVVTKLIWLVLRTLSGSEEVSRTQAALAAVFIAAATGGTYLTYDAGLPWVYHEVYLWAVTGAVGACYWMIRVATEPTSHATWWLFVFCLIAVGSRATEGWAVCLVGLGVAAVFRFRPRTAHHRLLWWRVALAAVVPLAVSITINEIKFDAVYMFPLEDQVWTQISEQRQAALEANGGTLTGPQFFTTSFMAYLRPDGIRFVDYFPWITLPAQAAPAYGGAVVDQSYRTGSVTSFMPLFMVFQAIALVAAFRPRVRPALRDLRAPLIAGILCTGGIMGYGYYSNRYASDFMPAMIVGGAVGTVLLALWLERRPRWRPQLTGVVVAACAVLAAFSMLAHMATGLASAAYLHRGEPLVRYLEWQQRWSGAEQAALTYAIDDLPSGGRTDDIAIRGDCEAVYLHTGDVYEPWVTVEERDRVLRLDFDAFALRPGEATVLTVTSSRTDRLVVQVNRRSEMRFVVEIDDETYPTAWFNPPTEGGVRIGIRNRIEYSSYQFFSTPGGSVGFLPSFFLDEDEDSRPTELVVEPREGDLEDLRMRLSEEPGLPLPFCRSLADQAGIALASP